MNKVYSEVEPGRLLHVIFNADEPFEDRVNLSDPEHLLQVSVMELSPARNVPPHIHALREKETKPEQGVTQECWIVLRGGVRIALFDLDQRPLGQQSLRGGHILVTFFGGHSLESESGGALMIECKNGPYLGRDYTTF